MIQWSSMLSIILCSFFSLHAQVLDVTDASSPNDCDGSAILNQNAIILPIYWYEQVPNNSGGYNLQSIATDVYELENLCPGIYSVFITYGNGDSLMVNFQVGPMQPDPCDGFFATMTTENTDDGTCTGSATVTISGGEAPYTYEWSNNLIGTNFIDELCAGAYYCNVIDASGCNSAVWGVVNVNWNNTPPNTDTTIVFVYIDSSNTNGYTVPLPPLQVLDCDLDYLAIGSAGMTDITATNSGYNITWTVYDTLGNVLATYEDNFYIVDSLMPNIIIDQFMGTLIVYCDGRQWETISLQVIDFYTILDITATIETIDDFCVRVVNPFSESLDIFLSEYVQGTLDLIDMSGRVVRSEVLQGTQMKLNTEVLNRGMYVLQIRSNHGTQVFKVLKQL